MAAMRENDMTATAAVIAIFRHWSCTYHSQSWTRTAINIREVRAYLPGNVHVGNYTRTITPPGER